MILALENGALARANAPRPRRPGPSMVAGLVSLLAHVALGVALFLRLPEPPPQMVEAPVIFVALAPPTSPPRVQKDTPRPQAKTDEKRAEPRPPTPPIQPRPAAVPAAETLSISPPRPEPKAPQVQGAPPSITAPPAPRVATNAPDSWQGRVLAQLDKHRRYPAAALVRRQQGVVYVRFTMDRQGKVLSARLEASSGFAMLDREAVSLPQRAAPLPKPPETVAGEVIELVVPVEFATP
ncbi:energy transducer TonB [Caulobacter segnis]|uniref:energy transducer TonB family protein n=1 Tax=Caulobacter segnis TaxID=88688 RepID=UPI001CBFAC40|nr:energy transducer TonB [Caulobacter segnis]UAL10168.1 TonB family protein [Caulobacter segnis]